MRRTVILALLGSLFAHVAWAQSRVVVRPFEGAGAARVRTDVVQALSKGDGMATVSTKDAERAADSRGADLSTEAGRVAVARELSVSAFVEGDVKKHGAFTEVGLRVYNGRDGALLGQTSIRAHHAGIHYELKTRVLSELASVLARGQPPAQAAPEPAPEPEPAVEAKPRPAAPVVAEPEAEPEPEEPSGPLPHALELSLGVRVLTRSTAYTDALLKLAVHSLDPTPALRLEARWYPAAHFTGGFVSNLGIDLQGQMMWPVDANKGSTAFKTTSTAFGIAARLRIPLSEHQLGLLAGYGGQSLEIANSKGQDPGLPSVAYGFVRLGADGRVQISRSISLGARAAYLVLMGFGELGQAAWFSHTSGGGLEAELSLGYDLSQLFALNAGAGMMRYFMSLNPKPTDASVLTQGHIAGGLVDQYFYGMVGVSMRL